MSLSKKGAVAAGHDVTADAAAEILLDGGNAFDAAIAALFAACVAEPVLASPGGGGFLMARSEGRTKLFDFFVDAPKVKQREDRIEFEEIVADFGNATQAFHIGAGASATPGMVPGIFAVHEQLGSRPMRRLVEPAVRAAREGVVVSAFQAYLFSVVKPILVWTPEAAALFGENGDTHRAGAQFRNPDIGDCLEIIGHEGMRIATEGEIARAMAEVCLNHNGQIDLSDIADYAVGVREPSIVQLRDTTIALNPLPSVGGRLIADMISRIDFDREAGLGQRLESVMATDRLWRDDPGHFGVKRENTLTRGTTHISVVDAQGRAAAVTVSNGEGNGRLVPGCGFMLNNMLGEEDVNPDGFHRWTPGARLSSMMAPTIATGHDGRVAALGSGGSNRIRTAVFQVLARRFGEGRHLADAIEAPRFHFERDFLDFEDLFDERERDILLGAPCDHRTWDDRNMFFGGVHAVERDAGGGVEGTGDPRRAGVFRAVG